MSACFYDDGGVMNGIDAHTYITVGPLGVPLPVLFTPHYAGTLFIGPSTPSKRTPTVTAESRQMIKQGFENILVPHVPLTFLPPHPAEVGEIALIIFMSSSKALLGIGSVTGEGGSLAICIDGPVGLNPNCGPGAGAVYNPSSVVTSPTAADFAFAAFDYVIGLIAGEIAGKLIPKSLKNKIAKAILKKLLSKMLKSKSTLSSAAAAVGGA